MIGSIAYQAVKTFTAMLWQDCECCQGGLSLGQFSVTGCCVLQEPSSVGYWPALAARN